MKELMQAYERMGTRQVRGKLVLIERLNTGRARRVR